MATDPEALKKIHAPILGIFAAEDRGSTPADVGKFGEALDQMGKKVEIKIYDDAGHAFENPNGERYRKADAADAWKRTVDLLETTLKSNGHDRGDLCRPSDQKPHRERSSRHK